MHKYIFEKIFNILNIIYKQECTQKFDCTGNYLNYHILTVVNFWNSAG